MEQYIPKSALVAEIKARISDIEVSQKAGLIKKRDADKKMLIFKSVLSLIDTIEVKEVELEKNSLTWKDISAIRRIMAECRIQMSNEMQILNDEELCKEVLKRFKAADGGD